MSLVSAALRIGRIWGIWGLPRLLSTSVTSQPQDPSVSFEPHQYIQKKIQENPVMIFSKTTCRYCGLVKEVLGKVGVNYTMEDIDLRHDCEHLQNALSELTGARTVPRVFIGGKCIGGGTEANNLHNQGKLLSLLQQAGASFKQV